MKPVARRGILAGVLGWAVALAGKSAPAAEASTDPDVVRKHMRQGNPPSQPLDSMMVFERGDDSNPPSNRAMTHEVLSLIHQEKGKNSYPWTLYTSLETHHETGDACVICSRLHKHGPDWSTGVHSEVFNHARAVALGANIEMTNDYGGADDTLVIGLNIQAIGGTRPMQFGLQIHDHESHPNTFNTAIGLNGKGKTGLDLGGTFGVGINAKSNSIRVDEGTCS